MMIHNMEQLCSIIETSLNDDGDEVYEDITEIKCRFRWITELNNLGNRVDIRSDAMLWVEPDNPIEEETIIKFDGEYFIVRRVTEARRLRGNQIFFLKCLLDKYAVGVEDASEVS